ncbi:uncharacterized protein LOC126695106 [Quercus robur]|uniref:uncharacterized protein LOC126695106 n=1 Tax=Quercus robur TaxID=38942 RepID=UPI0021635FAC|nr:uncharacterized protein LOC126695106 [Quercus robur]
MPWVIVGDFNESLTAEDKFGGRAFGVNSSLHFKECLDNCNMMDIGFSGPCFTWINKREVQALIQVRLDRFFVNPSWFLLYPEARVIHLTRCHSDHCSIMLELLPRATRERERLFKFQTCWLTDPTFPSIGTQSWRQPHNLREAIELFTKEATIWNMRHFELVKEFDTILSQKEELWALKSRVNWMIQGDRNTTFYHVSTLVRRKRNKILAIKNSVGDWINEENGIKEFIRAGFMDTFTSSFTCVPRIAPMSSQWQAKLTDEEKISIGMELYKRHAV